MMCDDDDQNEENPSTDENVAYAELPKMMCDQPGLYLVVTGRGKVNTELSHNQCNFRVGMDLAETGRGNLYNESGHNQFVPGTGFGNKTGLDEERHTRSISAEKKMENPQQRKRVWKKGKNGLFGWRTEKIQKEKSTSNLFQNTQTSKTGSKPQHTVSSEKKFLKMDNLLLMAGGGEGGGENQSEKKKFLDIQLKTKNL